MNQIRLLIVPILFLIGTNIPGQNIRFDHLDINDGLSQNSAFCMDIDANGYVWIGTLDGLNRYNGYSFEVFKPSLNKKGSLTGSYCINLTCDDEGNTWIVTIDGGLNKYDGLKQEFIHYHDSLFRPYSAKQFNNVKIDIQGWLWFKTSSKIIGFNPKDSSLVTPLPKTQILDIANIPSGNIAAYGDFGVIEMVFGKDSSFYPQKRITEPTNALSCNKNQTVALHNDGISFYNELLTKRTERYLYGSIKDCPPIKKNPPIFTDSDKIWVGGNNGLIRFELTATEMICQNYEYNSNDPNSFHGYNVSNIKMDKAGNIWVGTTKHGVNFIGKRKNSFKHFNWKRNASSDKEIDLVRAIWASSGNEYWVGFDRTGLGIIHQNGNQTLIDSYVDENGNNRKLLSVRTIFEDKLENIWVGMLNGFCIYNRKTKRLEHINRYFSNKWNNRSYSIKEFKNGNVAIGVGSRLGILNLKNNSELIFDYEQTAKVSSNIRDIELDGDIVWLGLDNSGIVKVNITTKEITYFNTLSVGLSNHKIYSLIKVGDDLWVGSNNGLNRFNTKSNKVEEIYYEEHGLSNNIVYSLNSDSDDNLWISTNRGISKFNTQTKRFSTYLKSDFFMDDASFQSKDGTIYYGGYNGVIYFDPKMIQSNNEAVSPVIKNFSLNNTIVKTNEIINKRELLSEHINQTNTILLNHFENTFSFDFNAVPFDLPNSNKFRYKLVNWQDNWEDGKNRMASFTNVLPGKYKFVLSVTGSDENWSAPKEIIIVIKPPFWQKNWFRLTILGIIFLLLLTLYRWRVYRIHQRNKLLKQKVDEQTKDIVRKSSEIQKMSQKLHEADEAKLRFFTNISHEFRTPLTLILGHLEELEDSKSVTVKKVIRNNALRLLRLVNQLIEFRKLDQDQLKLEVSNFELNAFVGDIVESFQKLAQQKNIDLRYEPNVNRISVWLDVDKTEKILFNLISNAIKYTPENNPIIISTHESEQHFEIKVTDFGIGISKDELSQVFNRFFRSKNSHESGHGIGLTLAKGLTEMQLGILSVTSEKGKGSVFTAQFNKGKEHFDQLDISNRLPAPLPLTENTEVVTPLPVSMNISDKRILLVEDDAELSGFLQQILSEDYLVSCAENGVHALQKLEDIIPDLIISDITMPQMDGITFCKKVKTNVVTAKIPFILLSAKTDALTRVEGFQLGIDDYIEKPFEKQVLKARVQALMSNREKWQQAPIETKTMAKVDKSAFSKNDVQFWKKTNTLINKNIGNPNFTTEVLSEKMNMSRSTFYRKFKGLSGENAADYVRKIRLHKAAELLQKKELNIQQIALEVGFQSTAHFRTKFKAYFGSNPSEYK
ncbi:response regulator [Saccharicrinis sp. GN24d3]|uniref:response regulator n=1 Tax=Saccharicrinis sp. GN24d3 TaxID=3458416 RepID=UPI00403663D4